jgi:acetyltransferase-like isoleucine patch superfamily enzyme
MKIIIIKFFKAWRYLLLKIVAFYSKLRCFIIFYINNVKVKSFSTLGVPYIHVSLGAKFIIGSNFKINNGVKYSNSGFNGKCRIEVRDSAVLTIGDYVGISDVTITCHQEIFIGNNVLLGVGVQLRDTDNHSLNPKDRELGLDWQNKKTSPIIIKENVFIGTNSIVLKGVTIGRNSIVGAGSVVAKSIPDNEIWAGNPAKMIKKISNVI